MERSGRRILLAVDPGVLEGALALLLSAGSQDEVVQVGHIEMAAPEGGYDAAVISDQLPDGVRAEVVITLPDTPGSGGAGTVRRGEVVHDVIIGGAEAVVALLEQYHPDVHRQGRLGAGVHRHQEAEDPVPTVAPLGSGRHRADQPALQW